MAKERVGILGGTFDPVHEGHIHMALSVLEEKKLDRLLVIPAGKSAYKPCVARMEDRWKMLVSACSRDERLIPSRLEMDRGAAGYTVDTLLAVRKAYPRADLFYIVGADSILKMAGWNRAAEAFSLCTFLVCPRPADIPLEAFRAEKARLIAMGARLSTIRMTPVAASSAELRALLSRGAETPNLYPPVREFCGAKGLYGMSRRIDRADEWIEKLFAALNPRRFAHSLSVALLARHLAKRFGVNHRQAEEAGLLHDCAKCLPLREMRRIAEEHSLTEDPAVLASGALLHSLVGAWVARNQYGMADPEVLDAISYHNTGHAGMSRLAMCVCLADSIEPTRESYPLLEEVRALSKVSLEKALLLSLEGTANFVASRGKFLHPRTQETIAWLKTLPEVQSTGDP